MTIVITCYVWKTVTFDHNEITNSNFKYIQDLIFIIIFFVKIIKGQKDDKRLLASSDHKVDISCKKQSL